MRSLSGCCEEQPCLRTAHINPPTHRPPARPPARPACQVWKAPGLAKSWAPMELHRTYGHCHADITDLDWSADSQWLVAGSKDLAARWERGAEGDGG